MTNYVTTVTGFLPLFPPIFTLLLRPSNRKKVVTVVTKQATV